MQAIGTSPIVTVQYKFGAFSLAQVHALSQLVVVNEELYQAKRSYDRMKAFYQAQIWADKNWLINCSFVKQLHFTPAALTNETLRESAFRLASQFDAILVEADRKYRRAYHAQQKISTYCQQLAIMVEMLHTDRDRAIPSHDLPVDMLEYLKTGRF